MNFDISHPQPKSDTPQFSMDELDRMDFEQFKDAISFIESETKLTQIDEHFSKLWDFQKAMHVDMLLQRIGEVRNS